MRDERTGRIGKHRYPQLLELISEGKTSVEIADILDINPETARKFARKRGLKIEPCDQKMENHGCWKTGTTMDRVGYTLQRVSKDGPYGYLIRAIAKRGKNGTDSAGYAPVHRIVAHNMLGRKLRPGEVVDHIDGNKTNNNPSNLRVFPSNAEHLRTTLKGKVPNWTPDGIAAIRAANMQPKKRPAKHQPEPTFDHPKIDDPA